MLSRLQAADHRRYRKDWRRLAIVVIELDNSCESGRRYLITRSSSMRRERGGTDAGRLLRVRDRQDPRPTLTDVPPHPKTFDTRRGSIGVHRVNPIPRALLLHDRERAAGKLVALNVFVTHRAPHNLLHPAVRRHVVPARRTVEDATIAPQHVSTVYLVDGRHLTSALRVEEHNPAVIVRFIGEHRRPSAPEPQRDYRIVRREETDRLSGEFPVKNAAPRERGNREHNDEERPSAGAPQRPGATARLFVGPRFLALLEAVRHASHSFRRDKEHGHAHPPSLGHEAGAAPSLVPTYHAMQRHRTPASSLFRSGTCDADRMSA